MFEQFCAAHARERVREPRGRQLSRAVRVLAQRGPLAAPPQRDEAAPPASSSAARTPTSPRSARLILSCDAHSTAASVQTARVSNFKLRAILSRYSRFDAPWHGWQTYQSDARVNDDPMSFKTSETTERGVANEAAPRRTRRPRRP